MSINISIETKSMDPDQTASTGAVRSWSTVSVYENQIFQWTTKTYDFM